MSLVDPKLMKWLVCPACRSELVEEEEHLACHGCHRTYPVVGGVPHLTLECATRRRPRRKRKRGEM